MNKEILNMEEAAELFGVSVKTFIKLLKEERVPARKIGREWRFSRRALIEWLSIGNSQDYSYSEGETKEFFNNVAHDWENISKNYYDESIKNKLIQLDIIKRDMSVVDLGAGDGYISRSIAAYTKKVIAVDISAAMLKELRKKAENTGLNNIETVESDGQDVPLNDSSVDMICASMYLHHIEEPQFAIREIGRLLKPGGKVFLADFYKHKNKELKEKMHDFWAGFEAGQVKKWFKDNGFKNIIIETLETFSEEKSKVKIFILTAEKVGGNFE